MKQVKVVVLGAGSAGLAARSEVAKLTDDYVVIDRGPIGTTCARTGCMPSKALIQAANDFHRRHEFDEIGIRGSDKLSVDVAAVFGRVRKLRDRFVGSVIEGMKSWQDKLLMAPAKFIDDRTLDVGGERIEAERIIIATGSRPIIPEAWQDYEEFVLDNSSIFDLNEVPASLAVVGLGVIGLELGQALSRLGVDVHA
ncbi:MAG: FAD-dependent oxidoreductase, partial [Alphaproteobacteria bacterium]|nr:FAD-dependent oxidoreductase [Alphaproteobacteria bacterium]